MEDERLSEEKIHLYMQGERKLKSFFEDGWVSERFKELVLKTSVRGSVPWVRIPPHPPSHIFKTYSYLTKLAENCQ